MTKRELIYKIEDLIFKYGEKALEESDKKSDEGKHNDALFEVGKYCASMQLRWDVLELLKEVDD